MQERLAASVGAACAHSTPSKPQSTAQRSGREAVVRSTEKAQAAERRTGDAEALARSLQQQLASTQSCAQAAQASLQHELDVLTVSIYSA